MQVPEEAMGSRMSLDDVKGCSCDNGERVKLKETSVQMRPVRESAAPAHRARHDFLASRLAPAPPTSPPPPARAPGVAAGKEEASVSDRGVGGGIIDGLEAVSEHLRGSNHPTRDSMFVIDAARCVDLPMSVMHSR